MSTIPLRLGTRGSPLALAQADIVAGALRTAHGWDDDAIAIVPIVAAGDRVQHRALAEIGGKALWTRELDVALRDGRIDFAVHSMKDVETIRPAEIVLAALLPRADVRDRLIGAESIDSLPDRARIGTASPRRAAQLLRRRPDLDIGLLRGNVATRAASVGQGRFDATLLAASGLDRLGHPDVGTPLPASEFLPAPQQGAIGIETLAEKGPLRRLIETIDDDVTHRCIAAERALLEALGADCRSPVAALARIEGDAMTLAAEILTNNGSECVAGEEAGPADDGDALGRALAERLLGQASPRLRRLFAG
ncbi:MAG: hydroxymethylbilane synthase [Sphingomonadales bacterium]|nr:hydroxymethylbilane synthase [Sphingomonadales bacterium]